MAAGAEVIVIFGAMGSLGFLHGSIEVSIEVAAGATSSYIQGMNTPALTDHHEDPELEALRAAVEKAREDIRAGRGIPYEDVRRWVLSWGTKDELPPPECP